MPPRPRSSLAPAFCALVTLIAPTPSRAQVIYYTEHPADFSGKEFAGLLVPATVERGDANLRASRAWVWTEGVGGAGLVGVGSPTSRILLQGDVSIELDGHRFSAAQAVVWSQAIAPSSQAANDPDRQTRQIAVYFDRVSDPGAQVGGAGYSHAADRLLVTIRLDGAFSLKPDAITPGRPPDAPANTSANAFIAEAEKRFQQYLRELSGKPADGGGGGAEVKPAPASAFTGPIRPGMSQPYEPNSPLTRAQPAAPTLPTEPTAEPLFAKDGVVTFAAGVNRPDSPAAPDFGEPVANSTFIRLLSGKDDNTLLLTGGVALHYADLRKNRNLRITGERAVIFLPPGPLSQITSLPADQIRGIYLEGDVVASDGQYTLRGPRVFYDFQKNQAVMADAVFSTIDAKLGLPIYVRAQAIRQEAANVIRADKARLSTSSFFTPVFSIGASSLTVTQIKPPPGSFVGPPAPGQEDLRRTTYIEASGITLRLGGVPFFWLPGFKGDFDEIPLEDVSVENSSGSGSALRTTWNVFSLLDSKKPEGVDARINLDFYFDRGWAFGARADWKKPELEGQLLAYMLVRDTGRDVLSNGFKKEQDDFRGLILAQNRWDIDPHWSLFTELSKISDETFIDGFFRDVGAEGREITSGAYLRYLSGNSDLSLQIKRSLDDFTPNEYLLQSQGAMVDKQPELKYSRLADDVLGGAWGTDPGLITWTHEYSVSRPRFQFNDPIMSDLGFTNAAITQRDFGVNPNQSIADRLRAAGFNENTVTRFDTRQELAAAFDAGPVRINPFVVGRFTGYDTKFGDIYQFSPDADKKYRAWYAAGARFSTELEHIDDSVESSILDLHRIRHIIQPSATVWSAGSNIRQEYLGGSQPGNPVYDDTVENLATGTAVRAGMTNTWQTQRGGPGRWHSVDVLKLSTDVTYSTADRNTQSPFGRFDDYRPEYSFLGNFFTGDAAWQVSDAVALGSNIIYDLNSNQAQRITAGGIIQHTPEFSTYAQVRYLHPLHATYVDAGISYQLSRLYSINAGAVYDTNRHELQTISTTLRRRFPEATLGVRFSYNNITSESSVGVVFEPQAVTQTQEREQRLDRLRDIGR